MLGDLKEENNSNTIYENQSNVNFIFQLFFVVFFSFSCKIMLIIFYFQ